MQTELSALLSSSAQKLIDGLNSDDNTMVFESWKSLASSLNQYTTYAEIPYIPNVPLAMYMYVMKYTSKRSEETTIRAITTFGVLMNAIENSEGVKKSDYLAIVATLLRYYNKRLKDVDNYSLFPLTVPNVTEYANQRVIDYGNTSAFFDSILLYIYNQIDSENQPFFDKEEIRKRFNSIKESFFSDYAQRSYDSDENIDGKQVLKDCYNRMNQVGKCPIFVASESNNEIYNKTYGLIPHNLTFVVTKYFLHETSGPMSEGELNSQIMFDIQEGFINISCIGINEQYLKNEFSLPLRECRVRKIEQYIEMLFDTKAYRDTNHKYGNVDNIPMAMELHFEHFKLTEISLDFIVGDQGSMRTIHLYGHES